MPEPTQPADRPRCDAQYEPRRRERGQRLVLCDLARGHDGDHQETDTGHTWPATPTPADADLAITPDQVRDMYAQLTNASERIRLARTALTDTGYFAESEVSDDIAPRIIEMHAALTRDLDHARTAGHVYRQHYHQARTELTAATRDLAHARRELEATRAEQDRDQARAEADDLTDQLGDMRATVATAEADRDDAHAALDATRRLANEANTARRQQLLAALGLADDGTTPLADYIDALTADRDRLREHSVTLNTVTWKIAEALGDVPPGADQITGDPIERADRIVRELKVTGRERDHAREQLLTERANLRADLQRDLNHARAAGDVYRRQYHQTRAELERVYAAGWRIADRVEKRADDGDNPADCTAMAEYADELRAVLTAAPVPAPSAPEPDPDRIAQAIGDPGSIVGPRRLTHRDGEPIETVTRWATRAVMAVLAETAAPPAVDHAEPPADPAGGARTDEGGPEAQGDAETATLWRCTDPDGDHVEIMPRDSGPGWIIVASPGGTYLTPDAADSLHTWLGQHLGHRDDQDDEQDATPEPTPGPQEAAETGGATDPEWAALITAGATGGRTGMDAVCDAYSRGIHVGIQRATTRIRHEADTTAHPAEAAHDYLHYAADIAHNTTPATPTPGPQDIPHEWLLALLRQADESDEADVSDDELMHHYRTAGYRTAITSAYRLGYAAALGCEITVEDDLVLIGDRAEEHQPPTEEDDWAAPDHAMIPAIARALFGDGAAVGTPVCAHCYRKIHHDGRRWRHTTTQAASCPEATPS